MRPRALYLHVPFCSTKCAYCAFHSVAEWTSAAVERMTDAVLSDANALSEWMPAVRTLYIGGGTPTVLSPQALVSLIERPRALGARLEEITVEANPESASDERLAALADSGVTRLSVGVQSLEPAACRALGRRPTTPDTLERIRAAWSNSLSFDLIHRAPDSSRSGFLDDLGTVLRIGIDHLSVYGLSLEADTPLARDIEHGARTMPDVEDEWGEIVDTIERHGLRRYEVSNFALPGAEAQHNLRYWRGEHYLGLGPSAVSTLELAAGSGAVRITQPTDHAAYLARRHVFDADREPLNGRDLLTERIMLGLRTAEGISSRDIVALAGSGAAVWERLRSRALGPAAEGLLVVTGETIRPTHRGMDLLDRVLRSLLDAV